MDMLQDLINKTLEVEQLKRERDNYSLGDLIEDLSKYKDIEYSMLKHQQAIEHILQKIINYLNNG